MEAYASFDLAPPGAFWYPAAYHGSMAPFVLISLPPEHSGIGVGRLGYGGNSF